MTAVKNMLAGHQRLIILRELMQLAEYSANDSWLAAHVLVTVGRPGAPQSSPPQTGLSRTEGGPAADAGNDPADNALAAAATWAAAGDGPLVPTLTQRGLDVATGTETVDGVQRPSPRDIGAAALTTAARLAPLQGSDGDER